METNKSVLQVMLRAYQIAMELCPDYVSPFSRHEFTSPQLFACLSVREVLRLSYRKTEAFLKDVPEWLALIGLTQAPDHNTLWRAFGKLLKPAQINKAIDLLQTQTGSANANSAGLLSIDSTCYEDHHRSAHYDRVCRRHKRDEDGGQSPGKWGQSVNAARGRKVRAMPKLTLAIATATHRIMAAKAALGNGSDAPDFQPMLTQSLSRGKFKTVVADAGFDSERNHEIARLELKLRSVIPARIGKRSVKPPAGRYRRLMKQRFNRKADAKTYGQRSQSETVNSMMKRNLGDSLRSITPERRKQEMLFKALVHNLMLHKD